MRAVFFVPTVALLFLVVVVPSLLLRLVLNVRHQRANLRANLPRAAGGVLLGIAMFVATMAWLGESVRAGQLVVFSTTLILLFLGRRDQVRTIRTSNSNS